VYTHRVIIIVSTTTTTGMRRSSVMALKREITRLFWRLELYERHANVCRLLYANDPSDPVRYANDMEFHLRMIKLSQDTLTARVLQLAGIHSGVGIEVSWEGMDDPDLIAISPSAPAAVEY